MQAATIIRLRSNFFLKPLLMLAGYIYAFIVWIRNTLFDLRILRIRKFNFPVISVGNISAGGTGKTPFTMELIHLLSQKYGRIAVISRGYKRRSRGVQLVSDGRGFLADAGTGGDEPVLIARRYPACIVMVAEKRSRAIEEVLRRQFQAELIILDDAFQHRWVKRDADIVLLANSDLSSSTGSSASTLLPAGRLREPLSNLGRANMVVLMAGEPGLSPDDFAAVADLRRYYRGYLTSAQVKFDCLVDAALTPLVAAADLKQLTARPLIAFAGIANPDSFGQMLRSAGINYCQLIVFPDHHVYSEQDLDIIKSAARAVNCFNLLTTEKDLVKLPADHFSGFNLMAVRIKICLESPQHFLQKLDEFIDKTG